MNERAHGRKPRPSPTPTRRPRARARARRTRTAQFSLVHLPTHPTYSSSTRSPAHMHPRAYANSRPGRSMRRSISTAPASPPLIGPAWTESCVDSRTSKQTWKSGCRGRACMCARARGCGWGGGARVCGCAFGCAFARRTNHTLTYATHTRARAHTHTHTGSGGRAAFVLSLIWICSSQQVGWWVDGLVHVRVHTHTHPLTHSLSLSLSHTHHDSPKS